MRYVYCPMCGERVIVPIVPVRKNGVLTCSRHHLFSTTEARVIIKSINRWVRRTKPFWGGREFGVDWITWRVTYPHISAAYQRAAEILLDRDGRFMPRL
jgi:hypothetical protein